MEPSSEERTLETKGAEAGTSEAAKSGFSQAEEPKYSFSDDSEDSDFDREFTCDLCNTSFSGLKPLRQHERSGKHLKALRRQKLQKEIDEDLKNLNVGDDSGEENYTFDNKVVAECEVCDKQFNGPESYRQHLRSKNHKRKLEEKRLLKEATEDGKVNLEKLKELIQAGKSSAKGEASTGLFESDEEEPEEFYKCEDCQKVFTGLTPFRDHMISKSHKKALKQKNLKERFVNDSDEERGIEIDDDFLVCNICRVSFSGVESVKAHLKGKKHASMLEFIEWKKEKKRREKEKESNSKKEDNHPEVSVEEETNAKEKSLPREDGAESEKKTDEEKEREKTLKTYESYKNYKRVMHDSKTDQ